MIQPNSLTKPVLLSLLLACLGATPSFAQLLEDARLEREARLAVFLNVKAYSSNASVGNAYESDDFMGLFSDTTVAHVIDFPMFNNVSAAETVSVAKYVRMYQSLFKDRTRGMSLDLKHMTYSQAEGHLEIRSYVTKTFKGSTKENEWRFEDSVFERNLEMVWRCTNHGDLLDHWDNPMDSYGRKKATPKLDFRIHEVRWHRSQKDKWVMMVNEGGLQAVSCGETEILRSSVPGKAIYVSESPNWVVRDSIGARADTKTSSPVFSVNDSPSIILEARSLQAKADSRPWSWGLTAAVRITSGNVDSEHVDDISTGSNVGAAFMASLGWAIVQNHEEILDVWIGAGASVQQHDLNAGSVYFEEQATDPDYFAYLRQTRAEGWNESLSETLGALSLGMRYLKRISIDPKGGMNYVGLSAGMTQFMQASTSFENSSTVIRQGYYEALFGITIDENGIYDFGTYNASGKSSSTSWSSASAFPIHAVFARKRNALTPWMTLIEVGPSFHSRIGKPSTEGPFVSNSQLRSAFLESNQFTFVNLDVRIGIRKRIGWNTIDPCDPQP